MNQELDTYLAEAHSLVRRARHKLDEVEKILEDLQDVTADPPALDANVNERPVPVRVDPAGSFIDMRRPTDPHLPESKLYKLMLTNKVTARTEPHIKVRAINAAAAMVVAQKTVSVATTNGHEQQPNNWVVVSCEEITHPEQLTHPVGGGGD